MSNPVDISNAQITAGAAQVLEDPYQFNENGLPTGLIFQNNNQAAHNWRHRSRYPPRMAPEEDGTIQAVMAEQETYIARMMQAMHNQDNILDNPNFRGRKLFTRGANDAYPLPDIEAACRCLFEEILDQCNNGYRGAEAHPVYVTKDTKLNCEQRVNKVIQALNDWKCICKEVYLDDKKIEALAHGPIGIYDSKRTNKSNNLQKKNTTAKGQEALKVVEELKTKSANIPDGDVAPAAAPVQADEDNQDNSRVIQAQGILAVTPAQPPRRRTQRHAPAKSKTLTSHTSVLAGCDPAPVTTGHSRAPVTVHYAPVQIAAQHTPGLIQAQPFQAPASFQRAPAPASATMVYGHLDAPNVTQQAGNNFVPMRAGHAGMDFQAQQSLLDRHPVEQIQVDMYQGYAPATAFHGNPVVEYPPLPGIECDRYDPLAPSLHDNPAAVYQLPPPYTEGGGSYPPSVYQEYQQDSFFDDRFTNRNDPGLSGLSPHVEEQPFENATDGEITNIEERPFDNAAEEESTNVEEHEPPEPGGIDLSIPSDELEEQPFDSEKFWSENPNFGKINKATFGIAKFDECPQAGTNNIVPSENSPPTSAAARGKRKARYEDDESETQAGLPDSKRQKLETTVQGKRKAREEDDDSETQSGSPNKKRRKTGTQEKVK